jgi:hypothetical protein
MIITSTSMRDWVGKRKYCSQMTDIEISNLFQRLKSVESNGFKWRMAGHTLDRIKEKGIEADYGDIVSTIHNADIVEYKIDENKFTGEPEERVVLASKAIVNRCYRLKAVYSLTERRIITVWINHIKDNHYTLDWNLYSKDMPVFGI